MEVGLGVEGSDYFKIKTEFIIWYKKMKCDHIELQDFFTSSEKLSLSHC